MMIRLPSIFFVFCCGMTMAATDMVKYPDVTSAEQLCPFTIEVHPTKFLAGDIVYVRIDFANAKDHPVWIPAQPLHGFNINYGILTYFYVDKEGHESTWKTFGMTGEYLGEAYWRKIAPGEKSSPQYERLGFHELNRLFVNQSLQKHDKAVKFLDEMNSMPMEGRLKVRFACFQYNRETPQLQVESEEIPMWPVIVDKRERRAIP